MPPLPREKSLDSTLALRSDPYGFVLKRCQDHRADLFETRILLRRTVCMMGRDAARLFYESDHFSRKNAMPMLVQSVLFGTGGVQALDGSEHRHRKQMFMSLMSAERRAELAQLTIDLMRQHARRWSDASQVTLYDEMQEILCRAVCQWAGVPLPEQEVKERTRDLVRLYSYAGTAGPRYWLGQIARRRLNVWMEQFVRDVRELRLTPPESSAASIISHHRDPAGKLLSPHVAAVEMLNVLRPTVAVSVYVVFAAHALHQHPQCRQRIEADDPGYLDAFVQEVRRYYPFFPAVVARVRDDVRWRDYTIPKGRTVMLGLYATNHDPRLWDGPHDFRPERFLNVEACPFSLIPQGGGDHSLHHRCPGEWITLELMKAAVRFLTRELSYDVPDQDLTVDTTLLPALPKSRFVIRNIALRG